MVLIIAIDDLNFISLTVFRHRQQHERRPIERLARQGPLDNPMKKQSEILPKSSTVLPDPFTNRFFFRRPSQCDHLQ